MDKYIGKRLDGRYEILEIIGTGGMANVYRAHDRLENVDVAVKILREEFLGNEDFVRRFKNESKAISLLSHPNIVKVFDVNFSDTVQCIVMELIDGITLKEYIDRQGQLGWRDAVFFTEQVLKALQHAHDRGIVHRDIKPQNIMLLANGTIKVMDFGIARFSRSETRTITDKAIGSVHYISPEQAKGDTTDAKADIYSTGVMLYEMLTGRLPFESDSPVSVAIKQISDTPKSMREVDDTIPLALEEITFKAMAKDPTKRYQSATQMLRDIEEFKRNPSIRFAYKY
ncbi:MAG: protein kinase, partial [Oscillospiraceae bacterium]|nr:protein kinase [Oscillospiraceae bacterium]